MDAELRQSFDNVLDKLSEIQRKIETLEESHKHDHDKLIRLETLVEVNSADLNKMGKKVEDRLDATEKETSEQGKKLVKYGAIISILAGLLGVGGGLI